MELTFSQLHGLIEIFTELNITRILEKSVQRSSEILQAKGCSIFLFDEASGELVLSETTSSFSGDK
ncbi:MAG: hypothetical protein PHR06_05300, partial [Candidatus Cloacimonetes bacterium]|nr:hypothetical protein [Candidatus Cloacimonadota bacterium]